MKLHRDCISPILWSYLQRLMKIDELRDYALVGGTNLALRYGHRVSTDIDLFTSNDYYEEDCLKLVSAIESEFEYIQGNEYVSRHDIGFTLYIGDSSEKVIKLDLWHVEPFCFPVELIDGIRMVSEKEIVAMKMQALLSEQRRQKDFWDIHEMLDKYTFDEMIGFALERYPYNFDLKDLLNSFKSIDQVEECPEGIICKRGKYWELIKMDLMDEVNKCGN